MNNNDNCCLKSYKNKDFINLGDGTVTDGIRSVWFYEFYRKQTRSEDDILCKNKDRVAKPWHPTLRTARKSSASRCFGNLGIVQESHVADDQHLARLHAYGITFRKS